MTRSSSFLIVLALSLFFLAGGYQPVKGDSIKDEALDAKITTSVKTHLAMEDTLKTLGQISVRTVDKTVYLTGSVPSEQAKIRAAEVALKVEHVQKVVNDIEVKPKTDK